MEHYGSHLQVIMCSCSQLLVSEILLTAISFLYSRALGLIYNLIFVHRTFFHVFFYLVTLHGEWREYLLTRTRKVRAAWRSEP